jgi:hypothetical protein
MPAVNKCIKRHRDSIKKLRTLKMRTPETVNDFEILTK